MFRVPMRRLLPAVVFAAAFLATAPLSDAASPKARMSRQRGQARSFGLPK